MKTISLNHLHCILYYYCRHIAGVRFTLALVLIEINLGRPVSGLWSSKESPEYDEILDDHYI